MANLFEGIFNSKPDAKLSPEIENMLDQAKFLIRNVKQQMRNNGIYGNLTYRGQLDDCISQVNRDIEAIEKGKTDQKYIDALANHQITLKTVAVNLIENFEEEFEIQNALRKGYLEKREGNSEITAADTLEELNKKVAETSHSIELDTPAASLDAADSAIWDMLYKAAKSVQNGRELSKHVYAGQVAAAVLSKKGNVYTGVCVDTACTLGICAERNALFNMITNGESEFTRVIAVMSDGKTGAPCGACREFMAQLMPEGYKNVQVMLDYETKKVVTLGEIMKEWWI